jgi:hypothetical protein
MRKMASEQLTPFNIAAPDIFARSTDVFTSSDLEQAVLVRTGSESDNRTETETCLLDLVFLSRTQPLEGLVRLLSEKFDIELLAH